jgi:hypothetical protein
MPSFGKKTPKPVIRDPLAVVPIVSSNVDIKRDNEGLIHLRQNIPVNKIRKKLAEVFGFDYSRKIALDEYGTLYFGLVDGKRSLREIIQGMVSKLGGNQKEAEQSVILFTKKLMTMRMIVLEVTPDSQKGRTP